MVKLECAMVGIRLKFCSEHLIEISANNVSSKFVGGKMKSSVSLLSASWVLTVVKCLKTKFYIRRMP